MKNCRPPIEQIPVSPTDAVTSQNHPGGYPRLGERVFSYFSELSNGTLILWCYLTWYLVITIHCFEKSFSLWFTALGISGLVGVALNLSTGGINRKRLKQKPWEVFRLFLVPFCVSSFSALVKDKGFILLIAPQPSLNIRAILACLGLIIFVLFLRRLAGSSTS